MKRRLRLLLGLAFVLVLGFVPLASAHRSGCHRWHSCPSDTGSYVCGDLGYCSQCPDNQYCQAGQPRAQLRQPTPPAVPPTALPPPKGELGVAPSDVSTCPVTHPIKGNFTTYSGERCIYHVPGGQFYGRTKPEWCYATEEEAQRDSCRRSTR